MKAAQLYKNIATYISGLAIIFAFNTGFIVSAQAAASYLPKSDGLIETYAGNEQDRHYLALAAQFKGRKSAKGHEDFATARHCLAQAIYFEARSEPVEGWAAVANVVVNRARDRRYPASICGVVYQNEKRRHRCQFSFACDGRLERAYNRQLWERAVRLAEIKLTGFMLSEDMKHVTHYHADYVNPFWKNHLLKVTQIGRHIFYKE